jgi:hypothetical protein
LNNAIKEPAMQTKPVNSQHLPAYSNPIFCPQQRHRSNQFKHTIIVYKKRHIHKWANGTVLHFVGRWNSNFITKLSQNLVFLDQLR